MKFFKPNPEKERKRIQKTFRKYLKRKEIKILLLGTSGSGKSTIIQQMKLIYQACSSEDERVAFRSRIFMNIMMSMKALLAAAERMMLPVHPNNIEARDRIMGNEKEIKEHLKRQQLQDLMNLWSDLAIQTAYKRSNEFQLHDSAAYYLNAIRRIGTKGWVPSDQDILHSQVRTVGIIETVLSIEDDDFRIVDVGGIRSKRNQWIHCFQDVSAVIFCVAMSEYDLKLAEDDTTNRMHESLNLFKEICNLPCFQDSLMILFLNKKDLFEEKITRVPLSVCFPEYQGGQVYATSLAYIAHQFLTQNETKKSIYLHVISATDTPQMVEVLDTVRRIVLRQYFNGNSAGIF